MATGGLKGFMWLDYVVFASTLIISLAVGIYHACSGGKQRTTSEYLMANRKLRPIPVALSMYVSFTSAVQILGLSAEVYVYGVQAGVNCITDIFFLILSAYMFIPLMHPLKMTSIHEYIFHRFNSWTLRRVSAFGNIIIQVVFLGLGIYSPATALEAVTGFPVWATVICTGVLGTVYTTLGGMKAVIWTDAIQSFIMFGGLIAIIATGLYNVGGFSEVWRIASEDGRLFINFDPDPTLRVSFWSSCVGAGVGTFTKAASHQMTVMRYSALRTQKDARLALLLQIPLGILTTVLIATVGLTIYAYYTKLGCDPLRSRIIYTPNQLVPYYIIDVLGYPGLPGLFVAVLFSATLSSVSSSLNILSALTWKDIIADKAFHIKKEENRARITRLLVILFGATGVGLSFVMPYIPGHVMQISASVLGSVSGAQSGIFLLGALFVCTQWKGGVIGYLSGFAMAVAVMVGQNVMRPHREILPTVTANCTLRNNATILPSPTDPEGVPWLFRLSYQYMFAVGVFTCLFTGLLMSFVTGPQKPSEVDPKYVVDYGARCCCCLPKNNRPIDCCGVVETDAPTDDKQMYQSNEENSKHGDIYSLSLQPADQEDINQQDTAVTTTPIGIRMQSGRAEHDGTEKLNDSEMSSYL